MLPLCRIFKSKQKDGFLRKDYVVGLVDPPVGVVPVVGVVLPDAAELFLAA